MTRGFDFPPCVGGGGGGEPGVRVAMGFVRRGEGVRKNDLLVAGGGGGGVILYVEQPFDCFRVAGCGWVFGWIDVDRDEKLVFSHDLFLYWRICFLLFFSILFFSSFLFFFFF